jgi:phosphohistidine phosphatase
MKTLLLMRHAKSNQADHQYPERQRPLTPKGEFRAAEMGAWILERELDPQLILTSTALRASRTAELAGSASGYQGEIQALDCLYMAEADEIIRLLATLPDALQRVMVVGHNPGLESLIPLLTEQIVSLPTAGLAYLKLPIEHWADLKTSTPAELVELWRPKEIETQSMAMPIPVTGSYSD